jgi:hypothetical protein
VVSVKRRTEAASVASPVQSAAAELSDPAGASVTPTMPLSTWSPRKTFGSSNRTAGGVALRST